MLEAYTARDPADAIDVKKRFLRFLFLSRFLRFLTFFFIFPAFFIIKNVSKAFNKKQF